MAELVKFGRGSQETYESNWEETMQDFVYFAEDTQTIFMNGKEYSACCEACLEWEDTGDYNYIVMLDGTIHEIDDIDEFCLSGNEEETQTFTSDGSSLTVTKEDIKEVHASLPVSSTNYWCNELFYSWTNLTTADIVFKYSTITSSGTYFGNYMFYNCSSLTTINKDFTLPQSFTTVGDRFCCNMFWKCSSLAELPKNFNLPQKLITVGNHFTCNSVYNTDTGFLRGTLITKLPSKFNIPQDIESVGQQFCGNLISGCAYLEELPDGFNLPQKLTTVPAAFCGGMTASLEIGFARGCTSLKKLPKGFNLPPNLTSVGSQFCNSMFDNCTSLEELPEGFNFPQGITSVGDNFAGSMFINCSALKAFPEGFTFPQGITGKVTSFGYGQAPYGGRGGTFSGCSSIKKFPDGFNLPQNITELGNYSFGQIYSSGLFQGCSSLEELPEGFNLPQKITTVATRVFNNMFSNCTSLKRLPEGFSLPPLVTECGDYYCAAMFSGCSSLEILPDSFNVSPAVIKSGTYFCQSFFTNCSSLETLPNDFNLPQNMESAGSNYCSGFFNGCSSLQPGTDVAVTFVFDATNCMSNTQFTPTSAEAGQTYYIKGNYDIVKTSFNIDISLGDIFTDDSGSVTFTGFTSNGVTYQFDESLTLHNGESGSVSFQVLGEIDSATGSFEYSIAEGSSLKEGTDDLYINNTLVDTVTDGSSYVWKGTYTFNSGNNTMEVQYTEPIVTNYYVITSDGTTYPIDDAEEFCLSGNTGNTQTFTSEGVEVTLTKTDIIEVNVVLPVKSDNGWCVCLFYKWSNCSVFNVTFKDSGITSVGNSFCMRMFDYCTSLTTLPDDFNLPQGITSVGYSFCYGMFYNCTSLVTLPKGFNLPQGITGDVGTAFCSNMFYYCTSLTTLSDSFTFPQGITTVDTNFCSSLFFYCTSLTILPDGFNLPQEITTVDDNFCMQMFSNCTSLTTLPEGFNLPQKITGNESGLFCNQMFEFCSNLQAGTAVALTFPYEGYVAFYRTSFTPTTAAAGSTYYIKGNNEA